MEYSQKLNAFKPRKTWSLNKDGLVWHDEKGDRGDIPYDAIKSVRLRLEPSRAETRRIAMHIYTPIDHVITNIDYKGPMNFKANTTAFRDFVIAFHEGFPKTSETVFFKGSTRGSYIANAIIVLVTLAFLFFLAPLLSLTGIPSIASIARIGLVVLFLPVLLSLLVKNKPATYDPETVPVDMLHE